MKTPYFIFYPEILKNNLKEFNETCKNYLKDFNIAYSIKTNSGKEVIKLLSKEGCGFEIASLEEINLVKDKSDFVVFNGPCKTKEELKAAIENNFLINIDSESELNNISKITKNKPIEAGLRIGDNKFGIEEDKISKFIEDAKSKNINITSLHFHSGTNLSMDRFQEHLKNISESISKTNLKFKFIDIGGGFPDKAQLKNLNANLEDYIKTIARYFPNNTIILEPGRCLVSDAFSLMTKVHIIKEKKKVSYAILDAGINLLPKASLSQLKFTRLDKKTGPFKRYVLAGPLLFASDEMGIYNGNLE